MAHPPGSHVVVSYEVFALMAALAVAVLLGRLLAGRLGVPDAAAYVVVGVAAGLVPGLPPVRMSPDLVLLLFLPPLVYFAAFFSDPRETMRHIGAVVGQSVFLVLATAATAAGILLLVFPDVGWAAALAFGAAIAPPDPVAATSVLQRLGVPDRLVTVLEAEGLINDGVALTLFALAVAGVGATPTVPHVLGLVAAEVLGGVAFGLLVGVVVAALRKRTDDPLSQTVWSLATPFLAYIPASLAHSSGVLATVTAAVWLGTRGRGLVDPSARLQTETFWRVLNLLLVAFLFVLLGTQVPGLVRVVAGYPVGSLLLAAGGVVVGVVAVRLLWAMVVPELAGRAGLRGDIDALSRTERLVLGWCGPRGAVSLAVALSLPMSTPAGEPFPRRDLLLFLTVVVVLTTLVGQVLPLPALLRWLRLSPDERELTERSRARRALIDAALREIDEVADERGVTPSGLDMMRETLRQRRDQLCRELDDPEPDAAARSDSEAAPGTTAEPGGRDLRLRVLAAERTGLRELAARGEITRRTQLAISQELDMDEARLRQGR